MRIKNSTPAKWLRISVQILNPKYELKCAPTIGPRILPRPKAELYKLEAVSMWLCVPLVKFDLISDMIRGISGIIENDAENPNIEIPVSITQMFS